MKHYTVLALAAIMLASACKKEEPAQPAPPPPTPTADPCTYTVGPWGPWQDGYRERTVQASPTGCTGTPPPAVEQHPCVNSNRGWLRITNFSANPYRVTITGPTSWPPFDMPGGTVRDSIYVGVGTYGLYALQLSGYVFTPSEFNGTRTVVRCNVGQWSFP